MPPLSLLIKPASGHCNMRCSYCFYVDEMSHRQVKSRGFMSLETAEKTIRRALAYADGSCTFAFQGGEPTLMGADFYRNWLTLVERYNTRKLKINYVMQTNGYVLEDELLTLLQAQRFLLGVSLDGSRSLHDSRRLSAHGLGTFDQISGNLNRLLELGIDYNILCVVDDDLAPHAKEVFRDLRHHGHLQFIPCLDPIGGETGHYLSPEAYGGFLLGMFECYEQAFYQNQYVSIGTFDNWVRMLAGFVPRACSMQGHCSANYVVEADGSVYPCDFYALDPWYLGNLHDQSFYTMAQSKVLGSFLASSYITPAACRDCRWLQICRAGCRRDRFFDPKGLPLGNRLCAAYSHFFEYCYERLFRLSKQAFPT